MGNAQIARPHVRRPPAKTQDVDYRRIDGPRQLRYLRDLATSRGQSFGYPQTRAEASAEIARLKAARPDTRLDRGLERTVNGDHLDATAIQPGEIRGHGSQARWTHGSESTR